MNSKGQMKSHCRRGSGVAPYKWQMLVGLAAKPEIDARDMEAGSRYMYEKRLAHEKDKIRRARDKFLGIDWNVVRDLIDNEGLSLEQAKRESLY